MSTRSSTLVLIAEDDDAVTRSLSRLIAEYCDVERVGSLREALARIEQSGYAALICDWDLGDGSGAIAQARSAIPMPVGSFTRHDVQVKSRHRRPGSRM